jgi:sugar O-acyltransferase (sialic acid O-acetyltransferase NeuD family)
MNTKKIALIGFGDLGHYIKDMLLETYDVDEQHIVYFDDHLVQAGVAAAKPFKTYLDAAYAAHHFYICLGYQHLQLKLTILQELLAAGRQVPNFIHHSSYVHPSVTIGHGSFIYPGCSIDRNTVIGNGTWIANADVIPHDCIIGDCCWFGASVTLSGKVSVGDQTFIGSGTVVSNALTIGHKVIIGLGSVITKNIADDASVIGNPMKILSKKINLT